MWFFISRETHPYQKWCQLTSQDQVLQGPGGAMQGDPALKLERGPIASRYVCQGSNPPRIPNKLRKEHDHSVCSSKKRMRNVCSKQAFEPPRTRLSNVTITNTLTSFSQQKISQLSIESQRVPNVMTECRGLKARKLSQSMEARDLKSKLQKKCGYDLGRKKSQKKKEKEYLKEVRVKEMATHESVQPTVAITDNVHTACLRKRKRKSIRTGVKYPLDNPSLMSLNRISSPRSSLSNPSEKATAYILSTLDTLSARPTIKYASKPRYVPPHPHTINTLGNEERKHRRVTVSEADLRANKRVDHLADRLSAHELRELMERDQKRKEKKKKMAELARTERRFNRHVEMQSASRAASPHESLTKVRQETPEQRPHIVQNTSGPVSDEKNENPDYLQQQKVKKHNNRSSCRIDKYPNVANPAEEILTSTVKRVDPVDEINPSKKAKRTSLSHYLTLRLSTSSDTSVLPTGKNKKSNTKPPQSWAIFKLNRKTKRVSIPPSISTISRDSLPSGNPSQPCHTLMRSASSIPIRTVSRFREDLPELPISSQNSRTLSSESSELLAKTSKPKIPELSTEAIRIHDHTISSHQDSFGIGDQQNLITISSHMTRIDTQDPNTLSQSLASIDSEASWLSSGRRRSQRTPRETQKHLKASFISTSENDQRRTQRATPEQVIETEKSEYFSHKST